MSTDPVIDLRQRLIEDDSFADALAAYRADRVIPIVAKWLRDQRPSDHTGIARCELARLADSLTPRPETGDGS